ncbi:hypothetical protein HDV06_004812 [Boothiomyces sp. JEL0866]|nr:hypothetical protein HDV06_004812 [Boothiomyces sp. JEL0866]
MNNETILDASKVPILIPLVENIQEILLMVSSVVVIEKEATFNSFIAFDFTKQIHETLLGKGFPDVNTRKFLSKISQMNVSTDFFSDCMLLQPIKIMLLVDADPDGVEIMLSYKYGSMGQRYQSTSLVCSTMEWIGLQITNCTSNILIYDQLIRLSDRDKMKLHKMLKRDLPTNIK